MIVISVPKSRPTEKIAILLDAGCFEFRAVTSFVVLGQTPHDCRSQTPTRLPLPRAQQPRIVTVLRFIAYRAQECL
jgi:hypothetical protein